MPFLRPVFWALSAAAILLLAVPSAARAGYDDPQFALGYRLGGTFPMGSSSAGISPRSGLSAGINGLYRLDWWFRVGGEVEWEYYGLNQSIIAPASKMGSVHTVTLMPIAEFRYHERDLWISPYVRAGTGVNLNFLNEASAFPASGSLSHTLALKAALGFDTYFGKGWLIRVESGWKMNRSELTLTPPATAGNPLDFDASRFYVSLGFGFRIGR